MITVLFLVLGCWLGYVVYRAGKRTGSIKGFNAGVRKTRRRRRHR